MQFLTRVRLLHSVLRRGVQACRSVSDAGGPSSTTAVKEPQGKEVSVSVSSLRADTVAAAGLDISRKHIWEAVLDQMVMLNGKILIKKSTAIHEGDIIEVDTVFKGADKKKPPTDKDSEGLSSDSEEVTVRRGRVIIKEIGEQTRKEKNAQYPCPKPCVNFLMSTL